MKKRILIAAGIIIALFHGGWYAISVRYQTRSLPDRKTIDSYLSSFMNRLDIRVDLAAMEETDIDINGNRLHLTVFPAHKKAPTVVFIPGTSVYARFYIEFMARMHSRGFTVVGFDPRGHGMSGGPRGDYTMTEQVDDALAVAAYARQRFGAPVALAGSSQGGMVAFYAAARDSSLSAVVCHNIADLNGKDNLVLSQLRPPGFMVPLARFMMGLYQGFSIPTGLYLDLEKEIMKNGVDVLTFSKDDPLMVKMITFRALNSLLRTDLNRPVEEITVPVMVIHSDLDTIFPQEYVEGIYNRLTCRKNYLLFTETDHLVMTNRVDDVVPPVAAWLKKEMR
jgi:alpha-beta hydrolase superfamily lysophospholipase